MIVPRVYPVCWNLQMPMLPTYLVKYLAWCQEASDWCNQQTSRIIVNYYAHDSDIWEVQKKGTAFVAAFF